MFKRFLANVPHYFSKHPTRGLVELYWSVGMMDFGLAAVVIFEPIFLFVLGYSLSQIMLFYAAVYLLYILLLPLGGRIIGKIGYEHSIFYSQFFLIAYYIALFAISKYGFFIFVAPVFFAIQKSLYWPSYHADFAVFCQDKQRSREVGGKETISMAMYILGPIAGGFILEKAGFGILFLAASFLFVLSVIPLFRIKEIHDTADFQYKEVFKKMFDKEHRRNFLAYLGFGEELIVLTLWPIFIYTVIKDYLEIGSLVALATLATAILALYLGKICDTYKKESILKTGSFLYAISWITRGFMRNAWQIFSIDTLSRFSKEMLFVPLVAQTYENAKKMGPLEYAVFFEQSLAVGKFLTALLLFFILQYIVSSWILVFAIAGILTFLYTLLRPVSSRGLFRK